MSRYRSCRCRLAWIPICWLLLASSPTQAEPPGIIFDTDIGNDIDDALALAMLHSLESRGHCRLLAITSTKDHPLSAPFVDLLNTFYGRPDLPIGAVRKGVTPAEGKFLGLAGEKQGETWRYPHDLISGEQAPTATGLLRRTLAAQPDDSVVIVQVGFSTNLARLLDSTADDHSPLSGRELIKRKVRFISVMAGSFAPVPGRTRHLEYNVVQDLPAARKVLTQWPTPVIASGYEIGVQLRFPHGSIAEDFKYVADHPIPEAYRRYCGPEHDRPSWDLTSVLYAVFPERGYFTLSPRGKIHLAQDGYTFFEEDAKGNCRYLQMSERQAARILEALVNYSTEPPSSFPSLPRTPQASRRARRD